MASQKRIKNRFAAKLLFQWRVVVNGKSRKIRSCEERIIHLRARSGREALKAARKAGKKAELQYHNPEGDPVFFEFIGVRDLLELGIECEANEVWYDLAQYLEPMERQSRLIPTDEKLLESTSMARLLLKRPRIAKRFLHLRPGGG